MTNKVSVRMFYSVVLLIVLLVAGFLGLGIRAFASAIIADFIFLGAFGVILVTLSLYFILRRPSRAQQSIERSSGFPRLDQDKLSSTRRRDSAIAEFSSFNRSTVGHSCTPKAEPSSH